MGRYLQSSNDAALSVAAFIPGLAAIIREFVAPIRASAIRPSRNGDGRWFLAAYKTLRRRLMTP